MSGLVQGLYRLRVFIDPVPDDKEGRPDAVAVQNVDERLGVLVSPGGVKADGDELVVPLHTVDRQLPLRGRDADQHRRVYRPQDQDDCGDKTDCG